jgi:hypothetical protein
LVALREAVQGGVWDADAVANALLGVEPRLFWIALGARLVRGRRSGFVVVAGESEDCGSARAASSAPGWRLSDVCERDQRSTSA